MKQDKGPTINIRSKRGHFEDPRVTKEHVRKNKENNRVKKGKNSTSNSPPFLLLVIVNLLLIGFIGSAYHQKNVANNESGQPTPVISYHSKQLAEKYHEAVQSWTPREVQQLKSVDGALAGMIHKILQVEGGRHFKVYKEEELYKLKEEINLKDIVPSSKKERILELVEIIGDFFYESGISKKDYEHKVYKVKSGDTVSEIVYKFGIEQDDLFNHNKTLDVNRPNKLLVGLDLDIYVPISKNIPEEPEDKSLQWPYLPIAFAAGIVQLILLVLYKNKG